jgi:D-alanyl-D-alanine carboxypeptidase/D-alanyl-D-alanine-endopeptidase (penicillin-binding protein 4)
MHEGSAAERFKTCLSVAGEDGSLRKRLKDEAGRVHAKTGTMKGIRALSGYVDDSRGSRYAFAILFNGYSGPSTPYKEIQDRLCRILSERD